MSTTAGKATIEPATGAETTPVAEGSVSQTEVLMNEDSTEPEAAITDSVITQTAPDRPDSLATMDQPGTEIESIEPISSEPQPPATAENFAGGVAAADAEAPASQSRANQDGSYGHPDSPSRARIAPDAASYDKLPDNQEPSLTDTVLAGIEHANGITRFPGNSVIEFLKDKQFSPAVRQLIDRWRGVGPAFFASYPVCCEIVYELHKETAKPGCKGMFRAALREIDLPDSTAYDMILRHKIRIGEMEDPDAHDSRDGEEEQEEHTEGEGDSEESKPEGGGARRKSKRTARPKQHGASPKVTLSLSGPIRKAVDAIKVHFHQANAKAVIQFCVLRVWREIETPLASRKDDSMSRPRRALATGDAKSVTPEYTLHQPSSREAQGASGAA